MFVFDATPLIYLAKAEKLEKVEKLEGEKIIPEEVYQEVVLEGKEKGYPTAKRIEKAIEKNTFRVETPEEEIGGKFSESSSISQADLQALELADEKSGTLIMDEEYGRNIAEAKGIKTHGTVYIILRLLKEEIIDGEEAERTFEKIIEEGWYCSTDLYKDIIRKIEELS